MLKMQWKVLHNNLGGNEKKKAVIAVCPEMADCLKNYIACILLVWICSQKRNQQIEPPQKKEKKEGRLTAAVWFTGASD